jgi:large subunit ribosomal protein L13e
MVKHNNQIPNIHCKKKWAQSSRGPLKVKLNLNEAPQKKVRRLRRNLKRSQLAPAPLKKLRPLVHCCTQKYNSKLRLGKGFTFEELKAVKLHPKYARTIGIAVDWRRQNKSEESLQLNVARLEEYLGKLVILKKGDAVPENIVKATPLPIVTPPPSAPELQTVTKEMKEFKAYTTMRVARKENAVAGYRIAVLNRKKKE